MNLLQTMLLFGALCGIGGCLGGLVVGAVVFIIQK